MKLSKEEQLREYGLTITASTTNPTRPGKKPRPVWRIGGVNLRKYEHVLRDDMRLRMYQGKFTAWEDPTDDLLLFIAASEPLTVQEVHDYAAERSQDRADRLDDRALKHSQEAGRRFNTAHQIGERFAGGQPILVGHHSEGRARADRDRMWNNMSAGVQESRTAGHLSDRAAGARAHAKMKTDCTLEYAGNRLKEARAELARCKRNISIRVNCQVRLLDETSVFNGKTCQLPDTPLRESAGLGEPASN